KLQAAGVEVACRLRVSEACPVILPYHTALDAAREIAAGADKIGTTGKGIGPAYEDKVARRAIRVADLLDEKRFAEKLRANLDFHNFVLTQYLKAEAVDYQKTLDDTLAMVPRIAPMVADVSSELYAAHKAGAKLLFEGAQGSLLDVDHGTYPFVTSSNCVAGNAAAGAGVGPNMLHYVLGITKAYTTRVGSGPFPSELPTDQGVGKHLSSVGHEFGTVTGRARRCGWFDAALLRRSVQINGVSGMCLTKLDVLDGLETLKLCTGYKLGGKTVDVFPVGAQEAANCEPIYEEMPGWTESTVGAKSLDALPAAARAYIKRIEELVGVPIDMVSTGPDREETIVLRHPFQ
ncbi:MAG TPA: adenylosuccinate synthase, partial [Burkholderiaceae bacterium]|nr:adenylosuccinate synthase [Burkholderiaceae bacterium]